MKQRDFVNAMNDMGFLVDYSHGVHMVTDKDDNTVVVVGKGFGMLDTDRRGFHVLSGLDRKKVVKIAFDFSTTESEHRMNGRLYRVEFQRDENSVCLLRRKNGGDTDICYDVNMRAVELLPCYKFNEDEIKYIDSRYLNFMVEA